MKAPKFLKSKRNRFLFFGSALIFCVVSTIYFSVVGESYPETLLNSIFQPKISKIILIAVPVIGAVLIIGVSNEIFSGDLHEWLKGEDRAEVSAKTSNEDIEPDVKKLYDSLKERYEKRFESKLDGRFEIPLEVSENWHSDKPKSYKFDAEAKISDAVEAVRKAFHEKGRLLIVGSPGSGKTVLLLKLARKLLGDEYSAKQKLPVIFNLASWSGDHATFEDWLIDVLNSGNGLSKDFAKTVLREKRIVFLLDGLDELARNEDPQTAHEKRAACLDSLNEYLREGRQAVICCRREEFAEMQKTTNTDAPVSARVEVLDLSKADILLALQKAQKHNESRVAAEHLEKIIETNDAFLEVLATPFYFTTALEVFDKHTYKDKDFPTDTERLKKHLLDKFIESKVAHTKKLLEFETNKINIKKWLKWLARLMEKNQLVTFELAILDFRQVNRIRILLIPLWVYFIFSLLFLFGVDSEIIGSSLILGIYSLAAFYFSIWRFGSFEVSKIATNKIQAWIYLRKKILFGLVSTGILISFLIFRKIEVLIISSILIMFIFSLLATIKWLNFTLNMLSDINAFTSIKNPYQRIFEGFFVNLFIFSLLMILGGINFIYLSFREDKGLLHHILPEDPSPSFKVLVFFWLSVTVLILTRVSKHFILRIALYSEGAMPLKYATFLDYAAEARILEKDGGQWRFRHQNLQEYFANLNLDEK